MRLQESPRDRARAQSTLAIILVVVACGICAYASEGVQWAFSNSDGPDNRPLHAIPASLPPAQEATVMPVAFAEATSTEKRGTLVLKFQDPEGVVPEDTLSELDGDHFQKGFILEVSGFQEDDKKGKLQVKIGSATKDFNLDKEVNAFRYKTNLEEIIDQGEQTLSAVWAPPTGDPEANKRFEAQPLKVKIDTHGPVLDTVQLTGSLDEEPELVIKFGDDDLEESTVNEHNFVVQRFEEGDRFAPRETIQSVAVDETDKSVVRITFGNLQPGVYRLRVTGTGPANGSNGTPLRDAVGNHAGGRGTKGRDQERIFGANPPPIPGKHVEFPEFQPTAPQPHHPRRINPGDKVETAVVRLYYFRNAHRVAQLLNRTAQSLNHAAVEQAERRAQGARRQADEATDERRHLERAAIRAVEALRRAEHELASAQDATVEALRLRREMKDIDEDLDELPPPPPETPPDEVTPPGGDEEAVPVLPNTNGSAWRGHLRPLPSIGRVSHLRVQQDAVESTGAVDDAGSEDVEAERRRLTAEKNRLQAELDLLEEFTGVDKVAELQATVASLREEAANSNEKSLQTQAKEDRAREEQFRLEVAAAHEDPDTYAAAKLGSVDPVAQVSISVIGEGLIQLRGPRKGIDRIRTMIEQIDSPVGQVKVEIVTVQLNGEKGNRMEGPLGRVEAYIGLGRFLTSQSLMFLRAAIQDEATRIALEHDQGGHYQVDRDRKYLYSFFGRDFIDELYEMDSEFLNSENKILGLHSMDTISQHQAFFILALARNDVRGRILSTFMEKVHSDLVQAEFDYRRSAELFPHKTRAWLPHTNRSQLEECSYESVALNNQQRYHFRNLLTFFGSMDEGLIADPVGNTMSPVQREFIRLAQIFKARMITEMELKQRIIERTMIEDNRELDLQQEEQARRSVRPRVLEAARRLAQERFEASDTLESARADADTALDQALETAFYTGIVIRNYETVMTRAEAVFNSSLGQVTRLQTAPKEEVAQYGRKLREASDSVRQQSEKLSIQMEELLVRSPTTPNAQKHYKDAQDALQEARTDLGVAEARLANVRSADTTMIAASRIATAADAWKGAVVSAGKMKAESEQYWSGVKALFAELLSAANVRKFQWSEVNRVYKRLKGQFRFLPVHDDFAELPRAAKSVFDAADRLQRKEGEYTMANLFLANTRRSLNTRKLLDFLIEEYEQKHIDLLEGTRAQIASVDNYLKRLSIALEDDFKVQFYDPAFVRIRRAAREWDVSLSQVERTSILTNNRALAKVTPAATMEFDLPKRNIAIVEALDGAKALAQDYGALLQDPTFLAAYQLMGGGVNNGKVQNVVPGLPSSTDEYQMGFSQSQVSPSGAALQSLVPDPSVFKFETGTGYEIRPVIQPDGHSIVYDFLYMYTTNVREPVQADEKHLGRVRRHFINTQVQTSSFEMRELSRYQVSLKVKRTAQGVPLLQDIPVAGILFRPLPSAESSIQQNIILAYSAVYPTLFDLMGLRWAPSVVDLNHVSVRDSEHVVRGRNMAVTDSIFDISTRTVDDILGIELDAPKHYRPDLYHRQRQPSPYHPGGYTYPDREPNDDPTGEGFETPDPRPIEMRQPPYDRRFRSPIRYEEIPYEEARLYQPTSGPESGVAATEAPQESHTDGSPKTKGEAPSEGDGAGTEIRFPSSSGTLTHHRAPD